MKFSYNTITDQIKRVNKNDILEDGWIWGSGPKKFKNNMWIYNPETKQRKSVIRSFEIQKPWIQGWGPRRKYYESVI